MPSSRQRGDRSRSRSSAVGEQRRHELRRAALAVDALERHAGQRLAIGRLDRARASRPPRRSRRAWPRHRRDHLGQLGVDARQRPPTRLPAKPKLAIARSSSITRGIAAMDQPALGDREGLGRVHRIDDRERRARAEALAARRRSCRARRRRRSPRRRCTAASARRSGRGRSRCRRSHRARSPRSRSPCSFEQALLGGGAHRPVVGIDVGRSAGSARHHSAACAVAAKVKAGISASLPGAGSRPIAWRIASISPSVALATARHAPWPPNSFAVASASNARTSGPLFE